MQKMSLSVTHSDNKINVKHNNRSFEEQEWGHTTNSHIDRNLTQYNTTFIKQDIREAYQEAFGEPLEEYNAKQKRQDRKIDDYYEYVKGLNDGHKKKGKGGKATTKYNLQDEIIITIGNKETWDELHSRTISSINDKKEAEKVFIEYKKKLADEIFKGFLEDFQAKHKHIHVFNAVAHYDEAGAPHMHMTFFGKAEGMKKGLRLQPRTTRAIAQDLDGDFYQKMLESDQKKYDLAKENRERKRQGLEPLQGDRKGNMSASADVYTQFLAETKQILIDKARELGLEYVATGTHDFGDMDHFKEAVKKGKEAADKEVNQYKQEKLEEIKKLDTEISDKRTQAQEADKTAEKAQETAKQAQKDAEEALQSKDEATREERIARQNAELAQKQAESFRAELERLKAEKQAQESELSELSEKIADQSLELEEAKEEKALLEADKNFFREQVQENISKISEQSAKISEQEAKISKNEYFMAQQVRQHDEQIDFIGRRTRALQGLEKASKVTYDEKGVFKTLGKVTMDQKHYENLKKKAGFFDALKDFAIDIVSTIKETSVYKALQAEVEKWKELFNAEKDKNTDLEKEKSNLEKDNDKLRQELGDLHYQNAISRDIGKMCEKYLTQDEKNKLYRKLDARAKDREEEDKRLERDDFSYDYDR
jgi:FtsZ-binding cell division protein ZapB